MKVWLDAQISPALAPWINEAFGVDAIAIRDLGLREADDPTIFYADRSASAIVMTKDEDFVYLLDQHGPPPQVIWITLGNSSNERLKAALLRTLPRTMELLEQGEPLVEIAAQVIL